MAKVDPKKLGALVDQHAKKKAPPKKPGGGGFPGKGGGDHVKKEAEAEGESEEHEQKEHDKNPDHDKDHEIAEQQASRVENGNGDDELHDLAEHVDPESDEVPEFALDADVWHRAIEAVKGIEIGDADEGAVIVHTYEALGGEVAGRDASGDDEHHGGGDEHDQGGGGDEGDEYE